MNRERFVNGLKDAPHYSKKQRKNIISRSLKRCNWKTKCTIAMEEFAELQQEVSKQIRGYDDKIGLLEEMADAFSEILDGSEDGYISEFMEPYLKVAAARVDEKIVVIFQYVYDTTDGVWKDRKIKTLLSQESATEMVQSLKDLVSEYSER